MFRRAGPETPTATEWDIPTWTTLRRGQVEFIDRQLAWLQAGEHPSNFPEPPLGYPTVVHDFEWRIRPSGKLRPSSQGDAVQQLLATDNSRGIVYLHNGGRGELWNAANIDGVVRFFRGNHEVFWTPEISDTYHEIWFMKTGW